MKTLGKIETSHVRDEFRSEIEFSKYLGENLDILGEKLGIDLSGISTLTEAPVGKFRCDIIGFLEERGVIAVENQFGASNHDHLGKLLVYFSNQDAKIGVWICEEAKPEHIKSVQWLNERSEDEDFFLLETKVVKIGDSLPAIDFDIIVGPKGFKEIGKERRKAKGVESEWTSALEEIGEEFQKSKPTIILGQPRGTYLKILTGFGGIHFEWHVFGRKDAKYLEVALHVETTDRDTNQRWIDGLLPFKRELEKLFREEVHFGAWSEKSRGGRWRKISVKRKFGKRLDDRTRAWAVESMARLYDFLTPRLKEAAPS